MINYFEMMNYYDKEGNVIPFTEWEYLFQDKDYQILKQTHLQNGTWVSTVWFGMEHGNDGTGPLIFETLVRYKDSEDEEIYRYSTEEQALAHHNKLCGEESTFLGNDNPSRWDQIRWDMEEED